MPSLVRFILVLVVSGAIALCVMVALATLVHVTPRPMEQVVAPARLK